MFLCIAFFFPVKNLTKKKNCDKQGSVSILFPQIGLYSRGKSHVLRMSVAVEILLTMCADAEEDDNSVNPGDNPDTDALEVDDEQASSKRPLHRG